MDVELFFNYIFDDAIARKSRNGKLPNKIFLLFPKQIGREIYIKLSKLNGNLNIWQDRLIFKFSHFLKDESDREILNAKIKRIHYSSPIELIGFSSSGGRESDRERKGIYFEVRSPSKSKFWSAFTDDDTMPRLVELHPNMGIINNLLDVRSLPNTDAKIIFEDYWSDRDRGIIMQALEESFIVDIPKSKSEAYQRISEVMRELGHSVKPYN